MSRGTVIVAVVVALVVVVAGVFLWPEFRAAEEERLRHEDRMQAEQMRMDECRALAAKADSSDLAFQQYARTQCPRHLIQHILQRKEQEGAE